MVADLDVVDRLTRLHHRSADCPHIDDPVDWSQRVSASSQLCQSDRRLDVRLPCFRVRRVGGVRHGERVRSTQADAAEAAAGTAARAAGHVDHDVDDGDDRSTATWRVDEGSGAGH